MIVSRGLVGPKTHPNQNAPKGKQVNIPVLLCDYVPTPGGNADGTVVPPKPYSPPESRYGEKAGKG
jgi:hypothetical protein